MELGMANVAVRVRTRQLLTILAKKNMSQNSLGRGAGLTSGHVSQLIRGTRNVSPRTRKRLLQALDDVTFEDIFAIRFDARAR
jgi:transcriptional regulator with XRE-family HTH domain